MKLDIARWIDKLHSVLHRLQCAAKAGDYGADRTRGFSYRRMNHSTLESAVNNLHMCTCVRLSVARVVPLIVNLVL